MRGARCFSARDSWESLAFALYNYSPARRDEDLSGKFVVHYKGETRKKWMLQQWADLLPKRKRN